MPYARPGGVLQPPPPGQLIQRIPPGSPANPARLPCGHGVIGPGRAGSSLAGALARAGYTAVAAAFGSKAARRRGPACCPVPSSGRRLLQHGYGFDLRRRPPGVKQANDESARPADPQLVVAGGLAPQVAERDRWAVAGSCGAVPPLLASLGKGCHNGHYVQHACPCDLGGHRNFCCSADVRTIGDLHSPLVSAQQQVLLRTDATGLAK